MATAGFDVVDLPGDKSIATRALLLALFADGPCVIEGAPPSRTTTRVCEVLRRLGADVVVVDNRSHVADRFDDAVGGGLRIEVRPPRQLTSGAVLECGGSATLARIVIGMVAGAGIDAVVDGSAMLKQRPMARVADPLNAWFGRTVVTLTDGHLPARVHRGAGPVAAAVNDVVSSAQVRSALTFAAIAAGRPFPLKENRAGPWRQHLEELCAALGIHAAAPVVRRFHWRVAGDPSAAAFLIAAVAAFRGPPRRVRFGGLYTGRGRTGLVRCLAAMGADVSISSPSDGDSDSVDGGSVVVVSGRPLRGIELAPDPIPPGALTAGPHVLCGELWTLIDEVPVVAMLCALATTPSRLCGLRELRVKESDRVARTAEMLQAFGAAVVEEGDDLVIEPAPLRRPTTVIRTDHDHRIAMTALTLGQILGQGSDVKRDDAVRDGVELDDQSCVDESWPGFAASLDDVDRRLRKGS